MDRPGSTGRNSAISSTSSTDSTRKTHKKGAWGGKSISVSQNSQSSYRKKPRDNYRHQQIYRQTHEPGPKEIKPAATLTTYLDPGHAFLRLEDHIEETDRFIGFYPVGGGWELTPDGSTGAYVPLLGRGRLADELDTYRVWGSIKERFINKYPGNKAELTEVQLQSLYEYLDSVQEACDTGGKACTYALYGANCVDFVQQAHAHALLPGHFSEGVVGGQVNGWGKAQVYSNLSNYVTVPNVFMLGVVLNKALYPVVKHSWANLKAWWQGDRIPDSQVHRFLSQYLVLETMQFELEGQMNDLLKYSDPTPTMRLQIVEIQKRLVDIQSTLAEVGQTFMDGDRKYLGMPSAGSYRLNEKRLFELKEELQILSNDLMGVLHHHRFKNEKRTRKELEDKQKSAEILAVSRLSTAGYRHAFKQRNDNPFSTQVSAVDASLLGRGRIVLKRPPHEANHLSHPSTSEFLPFRSIRCRLPLCGKKFFLGNPPSSAGRNRDRGRNRRE